MDTNCLTLNDKNNCIVFNLIGNYEYSSVLHIEWDVI